MKSMIRILSALLLLAAFSFANTAQDSTPIEKAITDNSATTATEVAVPKQGKKHAVWIKL